MRRSARSPQTRDLTELMIFLFFSVSAVSLAMLSWSMMGSQDLMGMQTVSRGQLEIVSREERGLRRWQDITATSKKLY